MLNICGKCQDTINDYAIQLYFCLQTRHRGHLPTIGIWEEEGRFNRFFDVGNLPSFHRCH
jgi:hypothetical protein